MEEFFDSSILRLIDWIYDLRLDLRFTIYDWIEALADLGIGLATGGSIAGLWILSQRRRDAEKTALLMVEKRLPCPVRGSGAVGAGTGVGFRRRFGARVSPQGHCPRDRRAPTPRGSSPIPPGGIDPSPGRARPPLLGVATLYP